MRSLYQPVDDTVFYDLHSRHETLADAQVQIANLLGEEIIREKVVG